eukprot:Hpha_TRINITY_DN11891_c0_g1::TRINITY_DN11891_c0_g1_i1::g.1989::m.1989/K08498/STX6; syntaxin 6
MTLGSDPFDEVRQGVLALLDGDGEANPGLKALFERWSELSENPAPSQSVLEELTWLQSELRKSIRQVEWDLRDLQETIEIVMKQPNRFAIDEFELERRNSFVESVFSKLDNMTRALDRALERRPQLPPRNSPSSPDREGVVHTGRGKGGYSQLDEATAQQYEMDIRAQLEEHDRRFGDEVTAGVQELRDMAGGIQTELHEQDTIIDTLGRGVDALKSSVERAMTRMDQLSANMSNTKKMCCIFALTVLLMLLIVLTFA